MQRVELMIPKDKVKPLVVDGKTFRSAYDLQVTEADLKQANVELGETESLRNKCLESLKKKLPAEASALHDLFLLRFVRFSKFNTDKAYNMMRKIHEMRRDYKELYQFPPNMEKLMDSNFVRYMPYRNEEGSPLFWLQFKRLDANEISPQDVLSLITIVGDLYSLKPSFQINSLVEVWDVGDATLRQYAHFLSLATIKLFFKFLMETYPWRTKRIILINCNVVIRAFVNGILYLVKKKIADRIVILGSDLSELHQYLDPALYPKEYGGMIDDRESNMKDFITKNVPCIKYQRSIKLPG